MEVGRLVTWLSLKERTLREVHWPILMEETELVAKCHSVVLHDIAIYYVMELSPIITT